MSTPPPDWLMNLLTAAVSSLPEISHDLIAQIRDRAFPLEFAIFGYAGTGKTTLLNRMQSGVPTSPDPTAQMNEIDQFELHVVGRGPLKIQHIYDLPGRPSEAGDLSTHGDCWPDWDKVFVGQMPRGIIFLVDHTNREKSKQALRYVINMIEQADEPASMNPLRRLFGHSRQRARHNLRVFLLLVNKLDLWETQGITSDEILNGYEREIRQVISIMKRNRGRFYRDEISALRGTNFERVVQNFMLGMLAAAER